MIYKANLVSAGEAAYILQRNLGSMRQWRDFLADNIRGKQDIDGLTLMPRAKLKGPRFFAPAYTLGDIAVFVQAVKAIYPSAGTKIKPVLVSLDTTRGWKISKFDKGGFPVAMFRVQDTRWVALNG